MTSGVYKRTKEMLARLKSSHTRGENHPNWNGGRSIDKKGYVRILMPRHKRANSKGYVYEHIITMENKIKRHLKNGECVHHLDGNRYNNKLSNLELLQNGMKEHAYIHSKLRVRNKDGRFL